MPDKPTPVQIIHDKLTGVIHSGHPGENRARQIHTGITTAEETRTFQFTDLICSGALI
jgi:hypothetical protein